MAAIANVLPSDYKALMEHCPPAPIRNKRAHRKYMAEIHRLMDRGRYITPDERRYMELLAILVSEYEKRTFREPSTPRERLRELLNARGMKPAELCTIFGSRGNVYDVLAGRRAISKRVAKHLAEMFGLPADVFI